MRIYYETSDSAKKQTGQGAGKQAGKEQDCKRPKRRWWQEEEKGQQAAPEPTQKVQAGQTPPRLRNQIPRTRYEHKLQGGVWLQKHVMQIPKLVKDHRQHGPGPGGSQNPKTPGQRRRRTAHALTGQRSCGLTHCQTRYRHLQAASRSQDWLHGDPSPPRRMWEFFDRLHEHCPSASARLSRRVPASAFDGRGNYSVRNQRADYLSLRSTTTPVDSRSRGSTFHDCHHGKELTPKPDRSAQTSGYAISSQQAALQDRPRSGIMSQASPRCFPRSTSSRFANTIGVPCADARAPTFANFNMCRLCFRSAGPARRAYPAWSSRVGKVAFLMSMTDPIADFLNAHSQRNAGLTSLSVELPELEASRFALPRSSSEEGYVDAVSARRTSTHSGR